MLTSLESNDYMTPHPVVFTADTDIFDAIHTLLERKVSGATVVNEAKEVIGVISELDCLKAIINTGYYRQGGGVVADFMYSGKIEYMDNNSNIIDAAQRLIATGHRRMPIQENGKFVGQISARSLLRAFKDSVAEHEAGEVGDLGD